MKLLWQYLRSRAKTLAAWALAAGGFGVVILLYSLPAEAALYGFAVGGFFMIIIGAADFLKFREKHRALLKLRDGIIYSDEYLPVPVPGVEEDYDFLVRLLHSELKGVENRMTAAVSETADCCTLWTHQIKTPIAAMGLILQREELTEGDRLELREELDRIEHYVQMALCFVRLSSDSSDLVIKEYSLDDIVKQGTGRFYSQLIRRRLRLSVKPSGLRVITDEKWLVFVIEQVMSNAVKYTKSGGIEIYTEPREVLCIRDSGGGVPAEDLPRIFEKGYTGEAGRLDTKASGIGLYLCKKVCDRLCHRIWAENCPGGLIIKISLHREEIGFE